MQNPTVPVISFPAVTASVSVGETRRRGVGALLLQPGRGFTSAAPRAASGPRYPRPCYEEQRYSPPGPERRRSPLPGRLQTARAGPGRQRRGGAEVVPSAGGAGACPAGTQVWGCFRGAGAACGCSVPRLCGGPRAPLTEGCRGCGVPALEVFKT